MSGVTVIPAKAGIQRMNQESLPFDVQERLK